MCRQVGRYLPYSDLQIDIVQTLLFLMMLICTEISEDRAV